MRYENTTPPSSDGLARKTKSLRKRSGKKPGGQLGHRGATLRLVATPDQVGGHRPARCDGCQPLPDDAARWIERHQAPELPPVRLQVTEHQIEHVRCPACGATTEADAPVMNCTLQICAGPPISVAASGKPCCATYARTSLSVKCGLRAGMPAGATGVLPATMA